MSRFLIALAIMSGIGGLGGWLSAGGGGGGVKNNDAAWALPDRPQLGDAERLKLFTALMGTNHFGVERVSAENNVGSQDDARAPRIAATWIRDGQIALSFESDDRYVTAGVGDVLPGGWVIKDASLDRATVERNGETIELTVFPYDNPGI